MPVGTRTQSKTYASLGWLVDPRGFEGEERVGMQGVQSKGFDYHGHHRACVRDTRRFLDVSNRTRVEGPLS